MKIAIINTHVQDSIGGSEIQSDIIASTLHKFGHDVLYMALKGKGNYRTTYSIASVELNGKKIAEKVIHENPDIVYWRNNKKEFYSSVKRIRKKNIPVVFAVSSIPDTKKWSSITPKLHSDFFLKPLVINIKKSIRIRWEHEGFKWVDGIVVNNENHLNKIKKIPQIYIPNSNTTEYIDYNWSKSFIVWVANLKKHKRPELCIELAKRIKDIDVIMIGEIRDNIYKYFENPNELPDNLYYIGVKNVKEVNGILQKSICLVHTCEPEGFPGNFIQAWLQGTPVVSFEYDPNNLINSEKLGYVSECDMDKFENDVNELIENHELREMIGRRAKHYAYQHFDSDNNVKKLEKFFTEIINA